MRGALGGPRLLLRRLREIMAEPVVAQARLDKIVTQIASNMVAEVCSVYVQRSDGRLELFATEGLNREAVHLTTLTRGEGLVGLIAESAEALALADSLGLDLDTCLQILQSGAAASFMLGDRGPRMIAQLRRQPVELRSRTDVMSKDMGIVDSLCRAAAVAAPVAEAAHRKYLAALQAGLAEQDDSSLATMNIHRERPV